MTKHVIPVGTSEPQDFALTDDGEALVGTGLDVALEIHAWDGTTMTEVLEDVPTVAWLNQAGGTVRVTGVENLAIGNYFVRFSLTNVADDIGYVPNGAKADLWSVVAIPAR